MNFREKIQLFGRTLLSLTGIYKSNKKLISGVCRGIAERFNWNVHVLRICWLLSIPFSLGGTLLVYMVLAFLMPEKLNRKPSNINNRNKDVIDVESREL